MGDGAASQWHGIGLGSPPQEQCVCVGSFNVPGSCPARAPKRVKDEGDQTGAGTRRGLTLQLGSPPAAGPGRERMLGSGVLRPA